MRAPRKNRRGTRNVVLAASTAACASCLLLAAPGIASAAAGQDTQPAEQLRAAANRSSDPGVTHPNADFMGSQVRKHMPRQAAGPSARAAVIAARAVPQTPGLDVSSWQGKVDWAAVKADGAKFAYAKATEGTGYTNPYFPNQYNGPYKQGMIRGAYHFALPNKSSGAEQANYFVDHGGGWSADGKTLPGALDIEWNPYGDTCYGLTDAQMVAWIRDFSDRYHARTGRYPVIYTARTWWAQCTGNRADFSRTNPLWVANYSSSPGKLPHAWAYQTIWQYANSGTFPGDQNRFNGDLDQLRAVATG